MREKPPLCKVLSLTKRVVYFCRQLTAHSVTYIGHPGVIIEETGRNSNGTKLANCYSSPTA
jgi:hypothetical protein